MSAVDGSAAAWVVGLWGACVFVLPDGLQPAVIRLIKTTIWQARVLPRWAPRWILLNSGKVMGVMLLRLGNSGLAENVKNLWGHVLGEGPRERSCARREARGRGCFRAVREGFLVIASNACFGPLPLLVWWGGFGG